MRRKIVRAVGGALGLALVAFAVAVPLSTSGCATFGGTPEGARQQRIEATGRVIDGELKNQEPTSMMANDASMVSTMAKFFFGKKEMTVPPCVLPLSADIPEKLRAAPASGLRITWLGHSTTLIEIDGRRVLTDPTWSERASPSSIVGPRRFHPTPLPLDQLPPVDAVLISHDHYDHLDMPTIIALAAKGVTFDVALGVGAHLEKWGVSGKQIVEHDWWEPRALAGNVMVVSTPSRHFSGRGLLGRNRTLWTSWAVIGPKHRVYFSGDTGQQAAFDQIREKLGPFDVAMLEIGQWHPDWGDIHLGPNGALEAHRKLGAEHLWPIHWGTFELGLHAWSEPPETVFVEAAKLNVKVVTPMLGEPLEPTAGHRPNPWWRVYPPLAPQCPRGTEIARRTLDDGHSEETAEAALTDAPPTNLHATPESHGKRGPRILTVNRTRG